MRMKVFSGGLKQVARSLTRPGMLYWLGLGAIFAAGAVLRTYHMDMPPFDFPSDRQKSNCYVIDKLMAGRHLFSMQGKWLEPFFLPWIVARTHWLTGLFHCEIWTLARAWSAVFGMIGVGLAALAGWLSVAEPSVSLSMRRRFALLVMAAVAFNPYHIAVSRMITTEPFTLAFQVAALALFWIVYRDPKRWGVWLAFMAVFIISVLGKLPSLLWLPGYLIYIAINRRIALRVRLIGMIAMLGAILLVLGLYHLNPFKLLHSYFNTYSIHAGQSVAWSGHMLWDRAYFGRVALMLTLPGAVLAGIGFFLAPWLYRITMMVGLFGFYWLVNLNTYNFSHLILPGMVLAAYGANFFIEAPHFKSLWMSGKNEAALHPVRMWVYRTGGLVCVVGIVAVLYPCGPENGDYAMPRNEIPQAVEIINARVPEDAQVANSDGTGVLSYFLDRGGKRGGAPVAASRSETNAPYYYSLNRFGEKPFEDSSGAWVAWASLPGEFNGILYSRPVDTGALVANEHSVLINRPPTPPPAELDVLSIQLPKEAFDLQRRTLYVKPGSTLQMGVTWHNPSRLPLAALLMYSKTWGEMVPVPLRSGGFATKRAGVLCLPKGSSNTAHYTLELPKSFPAGSYLFYFYPLAPGEWDEPSTKTLALPFKIECQTPEEPWEPNVEVPFHQVYPVNYDRPPTLLRDAWRYKNMAVDGVTLNDWVSHIVSTPGCAPGLYQLTLRGEAFPITRDDSPRYNWPQVDAYLPSDPENPITSLRIRSMRTGEFTASFVATEPFDSVKLTTTLLAAKMGMLPCWLTDFVPTSFGPHNGKQYAMVRGIKLERVGDVPVGVKRSE